MLTFDLVKVKTVFLTNLGILEGRAKHVTGLGLPRNLLNKKHFSLLQGQRSTWDPCCMTLNVHFTVPYRVKLVSFRSVDLSMGVYGRITNFDLSYLAYLVRMGPRYFRVIHDLTQATPGPSIIKVFYSPQWTFPCKSNEELPLNWLAGPLSSQQSAIISLAVHTDIMFFPWPSISGYHHQTQGTGGN